MREVSIGGGVAPCLLALFWDARFGGRCDGGVDPLGGEFVEDGDWGGAGGGHRVDDLVSHCRVNDMQPRENHACRDGTRVGGRKRKCCCWRHDEALG